MEKKFNDSSSALSRFARDKRVRTVTAAPERVERRPRTEKAQDGFNRRDEKSARPAKRASYNPHFSEDNRPLFEQKEERRPSKFSAAGRGRVNKDERRSFGEKKQGTEKPFDKKFDKRGGEKKFDKKPFGEKKGFGDKKRSFKRDDERPRNYPKFNPERQTGDIRLNRFLAQSGICSRREADDFITAGLVTVNGEIVTELGTKVKPTDEVKFNDERIQGEKKVYLVLNKPKGYVTSLEDPHAEKVVMDLVKNACTERIYPVGRLDKNSLGLLLFTNDGDLTKTLTHPSYRKKKIYQVSLDKPLTRADMDRLAEGITLEDGEIFADEISYLKDNKQEVGVEIHSGRNRIVRRMFEFLGYTVTKLDRVYYAGLTKKNLKRGAWRFLTKEEVQRLKSGLYE
ncbi:MAG: rRNA pseudouridine synthase [Alistipes sp.]|jgi:23S rRNA pseudouridine2605 synthase|nr:rRNA pseudouridine synthase [Alistipes sp.]